MFVYICIYINTHTYMLKLYIFKIMGLVSTSTQIVKAGVEMAEECLDRKDFVRYSTVHVGVYFAIKY